MIYNDKRFYSLNYFLKNKFLHKTIKISLNASLSCPNRDGTLSFSGCIFCSESGSGDFSGNKLLSITEQFNEVRNNLSTKWPNAKYIAYFQSFTNTYGDIDYLRKIFFEAISISGVVAISIATRPDCLDEQVLKLLEELRKHTYVFVELGFQSSKPSTIELINRCYSNRVFEKAVFDLKKINVNVVCHIIMGLPYETKEDMLNTVSYICKLNIDGVKIQLLNILKNTSIAKMYEKNLFSLLTFDQYIDIVISCLEIIPEHTVIHRLTGDGPKDILIEPLFILNKRAILNTIDKELVKRNTWQGKFFSC